MESKQEKVRHCSASSSLDEASCSSSTRDLKGATGGTCPCSCVSENHCCPSSPWSKETSTSGGKKSKGKLWKRASSKGETKVNTRGDDAQLLEQRSTNSSEFDSPSLSGSLPSVADSHCSHFSSELSCSDPETSRQAHPACSGTMDPHPATIFTHNETTVTPMPEVEHDHLEHFSSPTGHVAFNHDLLSSSPPASPKEGSSGVFLYVAEERGDDNADTAPEKSEDMKETSAAAQPVSPTRRRCIQTEI